MHITHSNFCTGLNRRFVTNPAFSTKLEKCEHSYSKKSAWLYIVFVDTVNQTTVPLNCSHSFVTKRVPNVWCNDVLVEQFETDQASGSTNIVSSFGRPLLWSTHVFPLQVLKTTCALWLLWAPCYAAAVPRSRAVTFAQGIEDWICILFSHFWVVVFQIWELWLCTFC